MSHQLTSNPVVGTLILLVLLYLLFRINNIDIVTIFTTNGLVEVYQQNPWIICLAIAMIAYAGYSMYVGMCLGLKSSGYNERFDTVTDSSSLVDKQFMSFDRFYQTFVMIPNPGLKEYESESETESLTEYTPQSVPENIVPPNRFMIFRTDIGGIKYYLIMDSMLKEQLPYRTINNDQPREYADQAAICKIDGLTPQYVAPTLIREDLLTNEYKQYVDRAYTSVSNAVDTQKALNIVKMQNKPSDEYSDISSSSSTDSTEHFGSMVNSVMGSGQQFVKTTNDIKNIVGGSSNVPMPAVSQTIMTDVSSSTIANPVLLDLTNKNSTSTNANGLTNAQSILQKTIYPRYIHHFFVGRFISTSTTSIPTQLDVIGSPKINKQNPTYEEHHGEYHGEHMGEHMGEMIHSEHKLYEKETHNARVVAIPKGVDFYYRFAGITRDQTVDVLNISNKTPFALTVTKSFSPGTLMRKRSVITSVKVIKPGTVEKVTKDVPIINDKKFVCGVQSAGILPDNFYNIYAETVTPQLDQIDSVTSSKIPLVNSTSNDQENKFTQEMEPRVDDTILFSGKNNTNVTHMDPTVNLYFFNDSSKVKYWFAKLDAYKDPTSASNTSVISSDPSTDPKSPYYGRPKTYPVGIIPADYKQCNTLKDGTIDTYCRGNTYVNGIDYCDARKINFEVASVQLNAL